MADFKVAIGFEVDADSKQNIQKIIDDIRNEKPEIKIKVNTEQALKDIKDLQKELKKLKDVSIKVNTVSGKSKRKQANSNTADYLSTDTNMLITT